MHGADVIVRWNFKHIMQRRRIQGFEGVNRLGEHRREAEEFGEEEAKRRQCQLGCVTNEDADFVRNDALANPGRKPLADSLVSSWRVSGPGCPGSGAVES